MTYRNSSFLENKIFAYSIIISCLIHAVVLFPLSYYRLRHSEKLVKQMEVNYYKLKPENKRAVDISKPQSGPVTVKPVFSSPGGLGEIKTFKEERLLNSKLLAQKEAVASPVLKDMAKMTTIPKDIEKLSRPLEQRPVERRITVPALKTEKINNPVYVNYYQLVRSQIKERAYKNYTQFESGDVYLTFVLLSDGTLKQLRLVEDKTSGNSYLRNVGLRSIKESSPFPPFPRDLKYPELSFNVIISFEVGKR